MKPNLLFDFDGTVANSVDKLYELINGLLPQYGYPTISAGQFEQIRNLPLRSAFKLLKLPLYKLGQAIPVVLHEYRHIIPDLEPCAGVVAMLNELKELGFSLALLSSNHTVHVHAFLDNHGITCFDWVEGTGGILQKHGKIKRQIKKHRLDRQNVVYVGDEARDIRAARRSGVRVISVGWGFHTPEHLLSLKPDYLVREPGEILQIALQLRGDKSA